MFLGGTLIAVSATPLLPSLYLLLFFAISLWACTEWRWQRLSGRLVWCSRILAILTILVVVSFELPYHALPKIGPLEYPVLGIIGDSITAGAGDTSGPTWPVRFAEPHAVTVRDQARPGATVATALRQAKAMAPDENLILLEIGGNDILGGTTPEAFEAGLEGLLALVCQPGRTVVMFELPLPPSYNRYGLIQRRLAGQYGVQLVPKRVLLGVLLDGGATLDTIHLSQEGHQRMTATLWSILGGAFEAASVQDQPHRLR